MLMFFNPTIEKFFYRITNTVKEPHSSEHHLGYTGLAPTRDDGTDEFCAEHHYKHDESQGGAEENSVQGVEDGAMNTAAMLMINDEVEIKTDPGSSVGTPDQGMTGVGIVVVPICPFQHTVSTPDTCSFCTQ
jgi:hypothetical protein